MLKYVTLGDFNVCFRYFVEKRIEDFPSKCKTDYIKRDL